MRKELAGIILILFLSGLILAEGETSGNVMGQNRISAVENHVNDAGNVQQRTFFCGTSTKGTCETDNDCIVGGCSNSVCQGKNETPVITTCMYSECQNVEKYNAKCLCENNKCKWNRLNDKEIKNISIEKNRLRFENKTAIKCPDNCACDGSTVKCELKDGREMTIFAGKSGNIIIQIKGENMTTNVTLYKSEDGKVYAILKNNETREVRMLPDQIKERMRERLQRNFENENITLDENGTYKYEGKKEARLFFIFPVKVKVTSEINPETGNITKIKVPWWSFLAKDKPAEPIMGASCGTVTPGYNDKCCQTKGYDYWNNVTNDCEFSN
jgi:eight-cysteine-cluster-containing protein